MLGKNEFFYIYLKQALTFNINHLARRQFLGDNLHEMSKLIFSGKKSTNCHLLNLFISAKH